MTRGMSEHTRGLLLTLTAVFVLSPDALLVRLISADNATLLFWRGLLSGGTLYLLLFFIYRKRLFSMVREPGWLGLVAALNIMLGNIFFVMSLRMTLAANTLVILASIPLLAALGTRIFLGETILRRTWIAITVAFIGILTLFSGSIGQQSLLGDLLAFCAACSWAGNLVIIRKLRPLNMIPVNAIGNLLVAPFALLINAQPFAVSADDFILLLILGVLVLPIAYSLLTLAPRLLPAPEVSLTMLLETFLGPFWVWLIIHESPTLATLAGGILILGTLMIHTVIGMRKYRPA
ncbi:MAG: EamA family transporter [Desulfuromonas sp.]|nr:MAG: EamA family transporter [Desulfuromonas sp.]